MPGKWLWVSSKSWGLGKWKETRSQQSIKAAAQTEPLGPAERARLEVKSLLDTQNCCCCSTVFVVLYKPWESRGRWRERHKWFLSCCPCTVLNAKLWLNPETRGIPQPCCAPADLPRPTRLGCSPWICQTSVETTMEISFVLPCRRAHCDFLCVQKSFRCCQRDLVLLRHTRSVSEHLYEPNSSSGKGRSHLSSSYSHALYEAPPHLHPPM